MNTNSTDSARSETTATPAREAPAGASARALHGLAPPFFLLYRTGFAPSNGTSVQLSRLLAGRERDCIHLMWDVEEGGPESVPHVVVADDYKLRPWPFAHGKSLYSTIRMRLQLGWWGGDQVSEAKVRQSLRTFPLRPDRAYVICLREWDARRAIAVWHAVGRPPFVLHVMDILHDSLSESETPRFVELIRQAQHVICISGLIQAEVQRCGAKQTSILPCATEFTPGNRIGLAQPLRIVLTGALWVGLYEGNPSLKVLASAWSQIQQNFPKAELHYGGGSGSKLPDELRRVIVDHGHLSTSAYEELLRNSHLGYLPVSHPMHTIGRFSVPSRLVDYLACGLPVITCTEEQTSIASFMKSAPANCSVNVTNSAELVAAVSHFASDARVWASASAAAAKFAAERLGTAQVRSELFTLLGSIT